MCCVVRGCHDNFAAGQRNRYLLVSIAVAQAFIFIEHGFGRSGNLKNDTMHDVIDNPRMFDVALGGTVDTLFAETQAMSGQARA